MKTISRPVQQHLNGFDCGVYVIAYATDIAFDRDPVSLSYDLQEMKKYLLRCLQRGALELFPNSSKRTKRGKSITYRVQLYWHCQMPFFNSDPDADKDLFMATFSACNKWFHKKCERINALVFKDEEKAKRWTCRTVKKFFLMTLLKTLRGVNEWTSHGIYLWELNIENGLFSTHFNAFISTQVFDVAWISRLYFEKHESLCFIYAIFRGGYRAAATSKMEHFVIIVNDWKPLTIITKRSILDVATALDRPLILSGNTKKDKLNCRSELVKKFEN